MIDVAASTFLWFPLPSVARLKYKSNAFFVSEETTLQLIGTLDVACIAALCPPFTVTRVGSPTINSRPESSGGSDRMCTMYQNLAGTCTPYFSMDLGIYYIATPETFAFPFLGKMVFLTISKKSLNIRKKCLGYGSVDFRLQNTKTPSCKPLGSQYFRITIRCQTDTLNTEFR